MERSALARELKAAYSARRAREALLAAALTAKPVALPPQRVVFKSPAPVALSEPKGRITADGEVYGPAFPKVTVRRIMYVTSAYFGVTTEQLRSARRTRDLVRARQIAMFLCRRLAKRSLPEIARAFGGRDHTTALHAITKIDSEAFSTSPDPDLVADLIAIARTLGKTL